MDYTVGPQGLLARASQRRSIQDGGDEVFNAWRVEVGVRGQRLFDVADAEKRATQRIEIDFGLGSDDAKLIADDARVPAHIHSGMDSGRILEEDGRCILDGHLVDGVGEKAGGASRLTEEEIEGIDAMTGDVEERASSRHEGIEEPVSGPVRIVV